MLIELTLTQDDEDFGAAGTKIMLSDDYVVGVTPDGSGSKIFVNLSDLAKFKTLYVAEAYETWFLIRLNP